MCLLVVLSRLYASAPLIVAANRDERMDRPAVAMTVLSEASPRILGGRDLKAGGTWLAVNEHGVVAGLTNAPTKAGRDDSKRSRGALPIAAARQPGADAAVEALLAHVRPGDYNPAWMLIGDRRSLYAVTIDGERPTAVELAPGVHVLENRPPGRDSAKTRHVLDLVSAGPAEPGATRDDLEPLRRHLSAVLADHSIPPGDLGIETAETSASAAGAGDRRGGDRGDGAGEPPRPRPVEIFAACVHTEGYGTRSSALVWVPADPSARPSVSVADGPPCEEPFVDYAALWDRASAQAEGDALTPA